MITVCCMSCITHFLIASPLSPFPSILHPSLPTSFPTLQSCVSTCCSFPFGTLLSPTFSYICILRFTCGVEAIHSHFSISHIFPSLLLSYSWSCSSERDCGLSAFNLVHQQILIHSCCIHPAQISYSYSSFLLFRAFLLLFRVSSSPFTPNTLALQFKGSPLPLLRANPSFSPYLNLPDLT